MVSLPATRYVRSESGWEELLRRSVENWPVMVAGSVIGLIALTGPRYAGQTPQTVQAGRESAVADGGGGQTRGLVVASTGRPLVETHIP